MQDKVRSLRISEEARRLLDAISDKPHITRSYGQWVCYWSGDVNLCIKARKFARELNRKRHKNYTHK